VEAGAARVVKDTKQPGTVLDEDVVVGVWIRSGELQVVDISGHRGSKRPRYAVAAEDLEQFLARRRSTSPVPVRTVRKRRLPVVPNYIDN
jgi:hypothetical protein